MHIDVPAGLPPARANPGKVQRVLVNLLHNALRHTPPEGEIRVAAVAVARRIETEVADTGEGIDRAARAQLFEPFAPGNVSDLAAPGRAGLGLSICRAIIEAHGGRVWLADSTRGTRVRFELPLALETV
jgi:signal transduction histidine kinase